MTGGDSISILSSFLLEFLGADLEDVLDEILLSKLLRLCLTPS